MITVALRYADNFAPSKGTIEAHREIIHDKGSVWYGKLGTPISKKAISEIFEAERPKVLLIHSGEMERYWAYVAEIQRDLPNTDLIPSYYRNNTEKFSCWLHITKFEPAQRNIMSKCTVVSSGKTLTEASRHSMSPYFIISCLK